MVQPTPKTPRGANQMAVMAMGQRTEFLRRRSNTGVRAARNTGSGMYQASARIRRPVVKGVRGGTGDKTKAAIAASTRPANWGVIFGEPNGAVKVEAEGLSRIAARVPGRECSTSRDTSGGPLR